MYIEFDEFSEYISDDPVSGTIWDELTDPQKQKWYKWIHRQIDQHPWKGEPLASFVSRQAFPRSYVPNNEQNEYYCTPVIVRFDSDPDANQVTDVIIPRQMIAECIVNQLNSSDIDELIKLRDIGVQRVKTGPLETEFQDNYAGNNPWPKNQNPLPEPLWSAIGALSTLSDDYEDKTFRITRG